jgi:Tfp pilus assembly protein PilO
MNNQKIKNNKTKKMTILLVCIFTLLLIGFVFWYFQLISFAQNIRENKNLYDQEVKDTQLILEIEKEQGKADEIQNFLDSLIIEEEGAVEFIEYIESLANRAGVSLEIQNFDILPKEKELEENLKMKLSAVGSWSQVNHFILMMENLPYYIFLESMNLRANQTESGSYWIIDFSITGLIN